MSAATRNALAFTAVTPVGGLLPSDMLLRIAEARNLPGTKPADYGLPASVPVRNEAERAGSTSSRSGATCAPPCPPTR
ncbi:hypothetical protein SF23_15200, partial [Streptomyces sp. MBRL 10]